MWPFSKEYLVPIVTLERVEERLDALEKQDNTGPVGPRGEQGDPGLRGFQGEGGVGLRGPQGAVGSPGSGYHLYFAEGSEAVPASITQMESKYQKLESKIAELEAIIKIAGLWPVAKEPRRDPHSFPGRPS